MKQDYIPGYNGNQKIDCANGTSIICGLMIFGCLDNRVLRVIDDKNDSEIHFWISTLNICVKGECPADCRIPEDYRTPAGEGDPYLMLHGLTRNCDGLLTHKKTSIYPKDGQSIEDLACWLLVKVGVLKCETKRVLVENHDGTSPIPLGSASINPASLEVVVDGNEWFYDAANPAWNITNEELIINKDTSGCSIEVKWLHCEALG
jgi:hypothetical protein